jgi:hypothetical protein
VLVAAAVWADGIALKGIASMTVEWMEKKKGLGTRGWPHSVA